MQLAAGIAQPVDQRLFEVHVDVLQLDPLRDLAVGPLGFDLAKGVADLREFVAGDEVDGGQHLGVGDRPADVLARHPAVERDAFGETFQPPVGGVGEHAAAGGAGGGGGVGFGHGGGEPTMRR